MDRPLELAFAPIHALCPGESYEIDLAADGGEPPYSWSLVMDSTGAKLSSKTGAAVSLTGALDKSHPSVTVALKDSSGATQTKDVALNVLTAGPGLCPVLRPASLPAACTNNPYVVLKDVIGVDGGTAPFSWEALSIPEGLRFDTSDQTVSGTALPAGKETPFTVRVTDAKGRQIQGAFPLTYRDKCWLAFTRNTNGDSRLRLYDPALQTYAASLDASSTNTSVADFEFSPDGELVAYRRATSDRTQELVLLNIPTWQEQVLAIPGSVLSYSWSPGARFLAVAYLDDAGNTWLGGIDATNAGETPLPQLTPVEVMDATFARLDSALSWLENNTLVAFHADSHLTDPIVTEAPYFVSFTGTGFAFDGIGGNSWPTPVELVPAKGGVFVAANPPGEPLLDFTNYLGSESDSFLSGSVVTGVADPAGLYVGLSLHRQLESYATAESGGTSDPPKPWNLSRGGTLDVGCDAILAWNPAHEQVVCDVAVGSAPNTTGEIRLYDLDAATTSATKLTLSQLLNYSQGGTAGRRRSFSPASDLFAFVTHDNVLVANAVSAQIKVSMSIALDAAKDQPSELAFSPDQTLLLWQSGAELGVTALETNPRQSWFEGMLPPPACAEDFPAGPSHWCGRSSRASALVWEPGSRFAAAMTATHGVRVYDFSQFVTGSAIQFSDACTADCNSDLVFQP